jgi:hypothetical protein
VYENLCLPRNTVHVHLCGVHASHRGPNAESQLLISLNAPSVTSRIQKACLRVGLDNTTLIACALILVTTDFLVLTLTLLHERGQLSVVVLSNRFGRHLDLAVAACLCDTFLDILDRLF